MASSVSSEHAFLSAGITICKRCSQLKVDIIEALQFIKCIYHQDLLFHEEPSTALEAEKSCEDIGGTVKEGNSHGKVGGERGWDDFLGDPKDDEGLQNVDSDDVFVQPIV